MSRATSLADLYRASVQEYTKTPAEWKGLLSCVARFYKRSFDNAVLIYAQKPDATQCHSSNYLEPFSSVYLDVLSGSDSVLVRLNGGYSA